DGIRDFHVTGVQTCALPISRDRAALVDQLDAAEELASLGRLGGGRDGAGDGGGVARAQLHRRGAVDGDGAEGLREEDVPVVVLGGAGGGGVAERKSVV